MNTLRLRAEKSAKGFYNRRQNEPVEALAGDGAGNVDVSGRLNWIWVRVRGDADRVAVAYNASARLFAEDDSINLLWVKRTGIGYYEITGYSGAVVYDISGGNTGGTGVRAHAWQHERRDQGTGGFDPLDLYPRMDVALRARPQLTPDLTLYVEAGPNQLTGNFWTGGSSAAFTPPVGFGQARIDLLYMDDTDTLQILTGTPAGPFITPTPPAFPDPSTPIAYVYLVPNQTTIQETDIYRDPRITVGSIRLTAPLASHNHTAAAGDGGILTNDEHDGFSEFAEIAAPAVPGANKLRLYAKDKAGVSTLYYKQDDGTEVEVGGGGGAPHDLLDGATDQDTTASTVTRGDLIVGNSTPAWDDFPIGTARQLLAVNAGGTDPEWASFDWDNAAAAAGADMVHDHSTAGEGGALSAYANQDAGISLVINDGGIVIATGAKFDFAWPWNGTITGWDLTADVSGSIVVDILDSTYAGFPGGLASIWGTVPDLVGAQKNQASGLSIGITKGHWARVNVNGGATTITRATLALYITRS